MSAIVPSFDYLSSFQLARTHDSRAASTSKQSRVFQLRFAFRGDLAAWEGGPVLRTGDVVSGDGELVSRGAVTACGTAERKIQEIYYANAASGFPIRCLA